MMGLARLATRAAIKSAVRTVGRPPAMERRPRIVPLSRLIGATPTRAAILRRSRRPSSGNSAIRVRRVAFPTPGTLASRSASACQAGALADRSVDVVLEFGEFGLQQL